jgi:hypothetical protein
VKSDLCNHHKNFNDLLHRNRKILKILKLIWKFIWKHKDPKYQKQIKAMLEESLYLASKYTKSHSNKNIMILAQKADINFVE